MKGDIRFWFAAIVPGPHDTDALRQAFADISQMQAGVFIGPDNNALKLAVTVKGVPAFAIQVLIFHVLQFCHDGITSGSHGDFLQHFWR